MWHIPDIFVLQGLIGAGIYVLFAGTGLFLGSIFDRNTAVEGNWRHDLPSTVGVLLGFAGTIYYCHYLHILLPTGIALLSGLTTLMTVNHIYQDIKRTRQYDLLSDDNIDTNFSDLEN